MNTWVVADWHLGEDRFELMGRPFETQSQMVNAILFNHNELVDPNDLVYIIGDICYQKTPQFLPNVSKFNGRKILIRGNHDRVFSDNDLKPYFDLIIPDGDGIELEVDNIPVYLTHYPSTGRTDRFNIVGHIHAAWKYQLNMVNVGVDVTHFRPTNIKQTKFFLDAISKFYDDDVWVSYNPINEIYRDTRGKKNTYLKP